MRKERSKQKGCCQKRGPTCPLRFPQMKFAVNKLMLKKSLISLVVILLALCCDARADSSIEDYNRRIALSLDLIESLKSGQEDIGAGVDRIKSALPKTEELQSDGQITKTDNQWLHSLLDQYKAEKDEKKKIELLDEASGRLAALKAHTEKPPSPTGEPADPKEDIKSILARAEYQKKVEDPITKFIRETKERAWELITELYNRAFNALFGTGAQASWLFRAIIIGGISVAIFLLVRSILRFRRGKKPERTRTILGEEIEEGMTPRDLAQSAEAAARAGDFRSAIRKLYISLLYELAERRLVELEPNATNHDYLARLSRFSALAPPLRYLTDRFDYTWYGMYPSSQDDYSTCLSRYQEAISSAQKIEEQPA